MERDTKTVSMIKTERYGGARHTDCVYDQDREAWWSETQTVSMIKTERYGGARHTDCVYDQDREVWWSETHRLCL